MNIPPVNTTNASTASKEPEAPHHVEILAGFAIIAAAGGIVGFLLGLLVGLLL